MKNIIYLENSFRSALSPDHANNELLEILYDFLPSKISFWSMKLAQAKFNTCQSSDQTNWLDHVQVFVGLPDWVINEEQMQAESLPHLKCPFGLLRILSDITEIPIKCALAQAKRDVLTKKWYKAFYHTFTFEVELLAISVDEDFETNPIHSPAARVKHDFVSLIDSDCVYEKVECLVDKIHRRYGCQRKFDTLRTALSTCYQLACGDNKLLMAFLGISHVSNTSVEHAIRIYGNLDIDQFFDWASDHFGLDEHYDDVDDLVDHFEYMLEKGEIHPNCDELYSFMSDMIFRYCNDLEISKIWQGIL